jgi:hypothetical protein
MLPFILNDIMCINKACQYWGEGRGFVDYSGH